MRSSRTAIAALASLLAVGCSNTSTTHGGLNRTSTSDGSGLEKVEKLGWKTALDAEFGVQKIGRTIYVTRDSAIAEVSSDGKAESTKSFEDKITAPLTVDGSKVFYGSGKRLVAARFPEGERLWTASLPGRIQSAPAVVGGQVVVAAGDLVALGKEAGKEKWSYGGEGKFSGPPAADGDEVFVGSANGWLYAIDVDTGQPNWELETESSFDGLPVSVTDEMIIAPGTDGIVWGVFRDSGRERWRFPTRGVISVGAAVHGDRAWVGTEAGEVSSLNIKTGQEVWRMQELPAVVTTPVWANGVVYVGCDDGKLVVLDAEDGAHKWSFQLESEPLGAPLIGDGEMWMADTGGRVYFVK